jgi:hypothetical protein
MGTTSKLLCIASVLLLIVSFFVPGYFLDGFWYFLNFNKFRITAHLDFYILALVPLAILFLITRKFQISFILSIFILLFQLDPAWLIGLFIKPQPDLWIVLVMCVGSVLIGFLAKNKLIKYASVLLFILLGCFLFFSKNFIPCLAISVLLSIMIY